MKRPTVAVFLRQNNRVKNWNWRECLEKEGYQTIVESKSEEWCQWEGTLHDLIVAVVTTDEAHETLGAASRLKRFSKQANLIVLTESGSEELAIAALRMGASDYFRMPQEQDLLRYRLRCIQTAFAGRCARSEDAEGAATVLIGQSAPMIGLKERLCRISSSSMNVLITGETGTGKELAAATIHRLSPRRDRPFVCINCAAIPESLFESEIFGHERGSFTGAVNSRAGLLEGSQGGSVFLDEVGDLAPASQAKLLRVIENKEIRRVGGASTTVVDIRFLAATHRALEEMVARGTFRDDLYYRLNVMRIHLPPLRNRREDIPALLLHYMRELNEREGRGIPEVADEVWDCLMAYDWPGNIRELKNLIEVAYANNEGTRIKIEDLPDSLQQRLPKAASMVFSEREQLLSALLITKWNKSKAAEKMHWSRMTLYRKLAKYQIDREFRPHS